MDKSLQLKYATLKSLSLTIDKQFCKYKTTKLLS